MVLEQIMAAIFDNLPSGVWKIFFYFTPMFQVDYIMISYNQKDWYAIFLRSSKEILGSSVINLTLLKSLLPPSFTGL